MFVMTDTDYGGANSRYINASPERWKNEQGLCVQDPRGVLVITGTEMKVRRMNLCSSELRVGGVRQRTVLSSV